MENKNFEFRGYEYFLENTRQKIQESREKINGLVEEFISDIIMSEEMRSVRQSIEKLADVKDEQKSEIQLKFSTEFIDSLINHDYSSLRVSIKNLKEAIKKDFVMNEEEIFVNEYSKFIETIFYTALINEIFEGLSTDEDSKLKVTREFFEFVKTVDYNNQEEFEEFKDAIERDFSDYLEPLAAFQEYKKYTSLTPQKSNDLEKLLLRVSIEILTKKRFPDVMPTVSLAECSQMCEDFIKVHR